jgi:hypothetical protein
MESGHIEIISNINGIYLVEIAAPGWMLDPISRLDSSATI